MLREFRSGDCFGIRIRTNEVRTGYKAVTVGAFDNTTHCFRTTYTSTEGVGGGAQQIRFASRDDAELYMNTVVAQTYNTDQIYVSNSRIGGVERCRAIPVKCGDRDITAFVKTEKWADGRERSLLQFKAARPEYFTGDFAEDDSTEFAGHTIEQYLQEAYRLGVEFIFSPHDAIRREHPDMVRYNNPEYTDLFEEFAAERERLHPTLLQELDLTEYQYDVLEAIYYAVRRSADQNQELAIHTVADLQSKWGLAITDLLTKLSNRFGQLARNNVANQPQQNRHVGLFDHLFQN